MSPRVAIALFVAVIAGLLLCAAVSGHIALIARTPFDSPPAALAGKARDVLAALGYSAKPVDTAQGLVYEESYLKWVRLNGRGRERALAAGRPAPLVFWYRSSPRYLGAARFFAGTLLPGIVAEDDPPADVSGMLTVELDPQGRLLSLSAVPPQFEDPPGQPKPFDWKLLFSAAGLDPAGFTPADPKWLPSSSWDARAAWTGSWPGGPPGALRVEAAAFRGKPVYFDLVGPWSRPAAMTVQEDSPGVRASQIVLLVIFLSAIAWGCGLARRNVLLGRGDRRGAVRLAAVTFLLILSAWILGGSHTPSFYELLLSIMAVSCALFFAALVWVLYLALEPYARRLWPQTLISWSRLLAGGFRDPRVAGDLLLACAFSVLWAPFYYLRQVAGERAADLPMQVDLSALGGMRFLGCAVLLQAAISIAVALLIFFLLLGLRALLRNQWLAAAAFIAIMILPRLLRSHALPLDAVYGLVSLGIDIVILFRFGLWVFVVATFVTNLLALLPLTLDFSAWYVGNSFFLLALLTALAAWSLRATLALK